MVPSKQRGMFVLLFGNAWGRSLEPWERCYLCGPSQLHPPAGGPVSIPDRLSDSSELKGTD